MLEKWRDNVVRATLGRFDESGWQVVDQQACDYPPVVKVGTILKKIHSIELCNEVTEVTSLYNVALLAH